MTDATLEQVDARVMAQVRRLVAEGVDPKEATARTCRAVMAEWPAVAVAYAAWLARLAGVLTTR